MISKINIPNASRMGIASLQLWLATLVCLFTIQTTASPITTLTNLNASTPVANGFPFKNKFEPLVNTGIRLLKQYYKGTDLFLVHSSPAATPWAHSEADFMNVEIEAREFQQHKLVVAMTVREHVGEWYKPFMEDWPHGTKLRTWTLQEWTTPLKDILKILDEECELPGPWTELQVMKYRVDRRLPLLKDELQLALREVGTGKLPWILYGMQSGIVHRTNLSNALPVARNTMRPTAALGDVQTS